MKHTASIVIAMLALTHAAAAFAQMGDLGVLLTPYFMQPREKYDLKLRGAYFEAGEDESTGSGWEQNESQLNFRYTIRQTPESQLYFAVDAYRLGIENDAVFSETGDSVPDQLADVGAGLTFRRRVRNDWNVGGSFRIGSASDELFNSLDEMYLIGTGILQIPARNKVTDSWIAVLNVNTQRRSIPVVPGFGYQFARRGTRFYGVVGVPFLFLGGRITKTNDWVYSFSYVPLRNVHAQIDYNATRKFTAFVGYDWGERYFVRADRDSTRDQTVYIDHRAYVGGLYRFSRALGIDARVGYAFDRKVGEGDSFTDLLDNRAKASDVWFVSLGLNTRF